MAKGRKTGGRTRGTPNKLTGDIKLAIEGAFTAVGGQQYLEQIAVQHPQVFCGLIGRLIPKTLDIIEPTVVKESIDIVEVAKNVAFLFAKARHLRAQEQTPLLRGPAGSTGWVT